MSRLSFYLIISTMFVCACARSSEEELKMSEADVQQSAIQPTPSENTAARVNIPKTHENSERENYDSPPENLESKMKTAEEECHQQGKKLQLDLTLIESEEKKPPELSFQCVEDRKPVETPQINKSTSQDQFKSEQNMP